MPFCRIKCDYCSFYSVPSGCGIEDAFVDRLLAEIDSATSNSVIINADTLYFGGGTPSLLRPLQMERIIRHIEKRFVLDKNTEITVEMNPEDLGEQKLAAYSTAGVNRIVLGVQSMNGEMRKNIGRRGCNVTGSDLELFFNHGEFTHCIDIMAGLPGQTWPLLYEDLKVVTGFMPQHISLYLLSVDDGTPLYKRFIPEDGFEESQALLWEGAIDFLTGIGYIHYEISNYALPGFESRHNSKYWDFTPYYGFGPGAHSFVDGKRYSCNMPVEKYLTADDFIYQYDNPPRNGIKVEFIMTALRRMKGFGMDEFIKVTGAAPDKALLERLELLAGEGLLGYSDNKYHLTGKGLLVADAVIYRLTEHLL